MCAPSGARRPSQAAWAVAPRAHIQRAVLAAVAASALSAHTPRPSIEALRPVGRRDPLAAWRATSPATPEGPRFAHRGLARPQWCQAHSTSNLLTVRQPPFVRPPQRRTSPPGRFEGASPKQGVTLRPEAKREKSPTSAQKARVHANPTPLSHRTASTAEARADEEAASLMLASMLF